MSDSFTTSSGSPPSTSERVFAGTNRVRASLGLSSSGTLSGSVGPLPVHSDELGKLPANDPLWELNTSFLGNATLGMLGASIPPLASAPYYGANGFTNLPHAQRADIDFGALFGLSSGSDVGMSGGGGTSELASGALGTQLPGVAQPLPQNQVEEFLRGFDASDAAVPDMMSDWTSMDHGYGFLCCGVGDS